MNLDLASDLVRFLKTGDRDYAIDAQRRGLLCPDAKTDGLKLTTKGTAFVKKWAPSFKLEA